MLGHYVTASEYEDMPYNGLTKVLLHVDALLRFAADYLRGTVPWEMVQVQDAVAVFARLYWYSGMLDRSEELSQQVLNRREKTLGYEHTYTLESVNNLGNIYYHQGRLDRAEAMYQLALTRSERALGPDHVSTLASVDYLGLLYRTLGKLAKAEEMHVRALAG
jgi:tetratricopeptide (TPR) repeat protein